MTVSTSKAELLASIQFRETAVLGSRLKRLLLLPAILFWGGAFISSAQSLPDLVVEPDTGSQFRLSWDQTPSYIVLEEADVLDDWRHFPQTPTLSEGRFSVMVDMTGVDRRFFRLHNVLPPDPASVAPPCRRASQLSCQVRRSFCTRDRTRFKLV